ncbi:MAG: diguanylate cyclase [bacterium]|nr:diguanylate cyclase [bacterium]
MYEAFRQTVLIVDDQQSNLMLLENILSKINVDIRTSTSGEEALELLQEQEFDLIILDIMMPGIDGIETANRIRTISTHEFVPIIFITSMNPSDTPDIEIYSCGAIDCLSRSLPPDILRAKIRNFLDLSRHRKTLEDISSKLSTAEKSTNEYIEQLEGAMLRTNQMTVEAEIAGLTHRLIFNTASDAMWVLNKDYSIKQLNKAFSEILGLSEEEAVGRKCFDLLDCPRHDSPDCMLSRIVASGDHVESDIELCISSESESSFIVSSAALSGIGGGIEGIVESFKDITERVQAERALAEVNRKLEHMAITDGLTGIANRRFFTQTIENEWRRMMREHAPLTVIMGDVDYFKFFNDTYGHSAGDDCLIAIARAMKSCVLRSADLLARYGGEEFVAVLPGISGDGAISVAENILKAVRAQAIPHAESRVSDHVSISLGIASMVPERTISYTDLIKQADLALYQAKMNGRNRALTYSSDMNNCLSP